jgi:hypothetical protein
VIPPRRRGSPWPWATNLIWIACGVATFAGTASGEERLNLFQRVARAELVVHTRVREGALKLAVVEVEEVIKGHPAPTRLRISFRDFNWTRRAGVEPIVFLNGQEEILFLAIPQGSRRKEKDADIYELLYGPEGRITLPAEGPAMILQAVRRLAELARLDPAEQIDGIHALLKSDNLYLVETALDEITRLRLPQSAHYPSLVDLLRSPSANLRRKALRVISLLFDSGSETRADQAPDESRAALAAVLERARNDTAEEVRVEAVLALAVWPNRREVESDLRAIAGGDPAQAVRYEAERALFIKSRS